MASSNDMTLEAISCKIAYLMGRGDLNRDEIAKLMTVSVRGEGESLTDSTCLVITVRFLIDHLLYSYCDPSLIYLYYYSHT